MALWLYWYFLPGGGGSSIILQMPYLPTIILWSLGNHDRRSLGCIDDIDLRRILHCDRRLIYCLNEIHLWILGSFYWWNLGCLDTFYFFILVPLLFFRYRYRYRSDKEYCHFIRLPTTKNFHNQGNNMRQIFGNMINIHR